MKLFIRGLCLILCLLLGASSALAAELTLPELTDLLSDLWDSFDLRDLLTQSELSGLTEEFRELAKTCGDLDDDELDDSIREMAETHGIRLSDPQVQSVRKLLRSANADLEKGSEVKSGAKHAKKQAGGFFQRISDFFQRMADLFRRIGGWLGA